MHEMNQLTFTFSSNNIYYDTLHLRYYLLLVINYIYLFLLL